MVRLLSASYLAVACYAASVFGGRVQNPFLHLPSSAAQNREAVKQIFTTSYNAYKQYAFGHDDLAPINKTFVDSRNGWGATIIDALSTLKIMGLEADFAQGIAFASKIDFSKSKTPDTVSVFETTIRYLAGILSAYELDGKRNPALLAKAKELGDKLAFAWTEGHDVPYGFLNFTTNTPIVATSNIAEAGTLSLEWYTLSKYTGNDTYRALAEKSLRHIANLTPPLPGLAAQGIDPTTGEFVGGYVTWGGGSDSYFEYLIKYARLTNTDDSLFSRTWRTAVDTSIKVLKRVSTVGKHVYLADYDSQKQIRHLSSHLACFHGGNWLLGARLQDDQSIINDALELIDACWNTYASTTTGIGPEAFGFISSDGNYTGSTTPITSQQLEFYQKHGFYLRTGAEYYILRPEVLESNFYAWRVTGNTKYLDRAASAIKSFNKYLKVSVAYAGIENVDQTKSSYLDDMESFWFAEVLKYLYLTFDDPKHISLDDYVFNTEAHPFRAPPAKSSYPGQLMPSSNQPFKSQTGKTPEISPSRMLPQPLKKILQPQEAS